MQRIQIAHKSIGETDPIFIIAEAGVNHNGDICLAKKLIKEAKSCGADCVKFQTFNAERIVSTQSPKAAYQLQTTNPVESQFDMLKKLELTENEFIELSQTCHEEGIIFLSTPYSLEDIDFLDDMGVAAFKVASGQTVEPYFLDYIARKNKPVLISTGMCSLAEVDEAVRTVRETGNDKIIIFQCTTNYPSALEDSNLRCMNAMGNALDVLVGYSDHTKSLTASITAASLGAQIIERHFTLDKTLPGPDQSSSSDPEEFSQLVNSVREVEKCLGSAVKKPSSIELKNSVVMRRSIVAAQNISAGSEFTIDNVTFKRPGTGIAAKQLPLILGRKATRDIKAETIINFEIIQ